MDKINKRLNVLIFPSGSGVSKEIFDSLKYIRWINIYGAESSDDNFSSYQFENIILNTPYISDVEGTLTFLKQVINDKKIDCIFPAMDNIIVFLKTYEDYLGVKIIAPNLDICRICLSKQKTYELFKNIINVPKLYDINNITNDLFPLFIKPECGYGSRNSFKVETKHELEYYYNKIENLLICEYLPGEEYTIDCFSSEKYGLISCEPRERLKTLNGMSILTKHINNNEFKHIGKLINDTLKLKGVWFFQMKRNLNGTFTLLEIAPRIPGALALHRSLGINYALLSIYEHFGINIDSVIVNKYDISCYKYFENNYKTNLEYDTIYVDLDDTIIIKNKVNTKLIQYLYYSKNIKKNIILITRNNNPIDTLNCFCISEKLFDNIIICETNVKKSEHMKSDMSIFIDDSYLERFDAYSKGLNVFSCDMIELLFDEKL